MRHARLRVGLPILFLLTAAAVPGAQAQVLSLEPIVTSGIVNPMFATSPPGDPNRLFVAERSGQIRVIDLRTNTLAPTPYLSIPVSTEGERGLLGMAFDPNFATNGRFYVNYSAPAGADVGDQVIARYEANGDPMTATTANPTELRMLRLDRPSATTNNHNGGWIGFSPNNPDNLYIAVGDGGGSNDTFNTAQSLASLHGKMLRIDVNNPSGGRNYGIPAGNPFAAGGGAPEIWAVGLRNPWRDSFDRATGDLWIADVGQNAREELDFQPAGATGGLNYGWAFREGDIAGPKAPPTPTPATVEPIHVLTRSEGASITGGYVYRGGIASLQGTYIFGDFITGRTWSFEYDGTTLSELTERTTQLDPDGAGGFSWASRLASFAEDANGELYMVALTTPNGGTGAIYRIVPEPSSLALVAAAVAVAGAVALRRRRSTL
jgi:glucose/arabinose dehydrogenase